eukprot:5936997-Prorocentrum_lima.AAC.1
MGWFFHGAANGPVNMIFEFLFERCFEEDAGCSIIWPGVSPLLHMAWVFAVNMAWALAEQGVL